MYILTDFCYGSGGYFGTGGSHFSLDYHFI